MSSRISILVLVILVMVSALAVIGSKHQSRQLYHRLQVLHHKKDHLDTEWAQLQLEESTWASQGRVERIASSQLNMENPRKYRVIQVQQ